MKRIQWFAILLSMFFMFTGQSALAVNQHHMNPHSVRASDGYYYVTWLDKSSGYGDIRLQKFNTSGKAQWSSPVKVNSYNLVYSSGWEPEPRIATRGSNLYIVWARGYKELRMMRLSTGGSKRWSSERKVNYQQPAETIGYDLAVDSYGYIYVNFQRHGTSGRKSYLMKMHPNGSRMWSFELSSGQGSSQMNQRIAISGNNILYLLNTDSSGYTWLRRMNTNGGTNWHSRSIGLGSYDITTDSSNNAVIAGKSGNTVYVKKYNASGSRVWSGKQVSSGAYRPRNVSIDYDGNYYVSWEDRRTNSGYDYEVYINKLNSSGYRRWSDRTVNKVDYAQQYSASVARDGSGGAFVAWHQPVSGNYNNVHINRVNSSGSRYFSSDINIHGNSGGATNSPPKITSSPVTTYYVDKVNHYQVVASDADGDSLSFAVTQGPAGYSINSSSGLVTYTPGGSSTGYHSVNIRVTDGKGGVANQGFTIEVKAQSSGGETPWKSNQSGTLRTNISWNYTMGYHFTPQKNGRITKLGGFFRGSKDVYLWDKATGQQLAKVRVNAWDQWSYSSISPVNVTAGRTYTVGVALAGSGGSYRYSIQSLPRTYGSIRILGSTYRSGTGRPTNSISSRMYGQADVLFE